MYPYENVTRSLAALKQRYLLDEKPLVLGKLTKKHNTRFWATNPHEKRRELQ